MSSLNCKLMSLTQNSKLIQRLAKIMAKYPIKMMIKYQINQKCILITFQKNEKFSIY